MPDSEVRRMIAVVPSRSGAYGSWTLTLMAARLSLVSWMSRTEPTRRPPTWTSSSLTSWPAFWKISVYSVPPAPLNSSSHTASATANASAVTAAALATVTDDAPSRDDSSGSALPLRYVPRKSRRGNPTVRFRARGQIPLPAGEYSPNGLGSSLHAERALRRAAEELAHELVVRVEQILGRAGLHDPAAPQHRDVLRDPLRRHDVVRDHHVGAAVLLVDLLDQLAQQGR